MFRSGKSRCTIPVWCAAAVLGVSLMAGVSSFAEEAGTDSGQGLRLCDEDEYLLFYENNQHIMAFDSDGQYVTEFLDYSEATPQSVSKDSLIVSERDGETVVFSFKTLQEVFSCPSGEYSFMCTGKAVMAIERPTGTFSIYNTDGDVLYHSDVSVNRSTEWNDCNIQFYELASGYLCGLEIAGRSLVVQVGNDGSSRLVTDPFIKEIVFDWNSYVFGDLIIRNEWNDDTGRIGTAYDLDGNLVMDNICNMVNDEETRYEDYQSWNDNLTFVIRREENGTYTIYDRSLNAVGTVTKEKAESIHRSVNGRVPGGFCEELQGTVEGFVPLNSGIFMSIVPETIHAPYTETENEYVILCGDGTLLHVPKHAGEQLYSAGTGYFVYTTETGDFRIRRADDGSIFPSDDAVFDSEKMIFQSESGLAVFNWEDGCTFYDLDGNVTYTSETAWVEPWKNGYFYMRRGIYNGYVDINGKWIMRRMISWQTEFV